MEDGRKKVFISYEWANQKWVKDLAETIQHEYGIIVKLDIWDLVPGQEKNHFMESMVTDPTIDNVLVICTPEYKQKADTRKGGVGTETQILTPEIYDKADQTKFLAVISEDSSSEDLPVYLKSRIYFDLSTPEKYYDELEKLCRHIYGKPKEVAPEIGPIIDFDKLDELNVDDFRLRQIARDIERVIDVNERKAVNLFIPFKNEYFEIIRKIYHEIDDNEEFSDEVSMKNINKTVVLQDSLIKVISSLAEAELIDSDMIIEFIEDHFNEIYEQKKTIISEEYYFDFIYFIMHEAFLIINTILRKYNSFKVIADLMEASYFYKELSRYAGVNFIRMKTDSLEKRKKRLGIKTYSLQAQLLEERLDPVFFKELAITDLLLHYIGQINPKLDSIYWNPITVCYVEEYDVLFFRKFQSKRFFEKVSCMFGLKLEEFKEYLTINQVGSHFDNIPVLVEYFNGAGNIGKFS
ncbi:toll/interleukin-1 receptor domain-containing protein [Listeria monocytogenes]|uniref:toll/interleukin-1 receptor domain-containing protein n=1 Tax=Listeria monocytogenes TaxID=1639 RepID=UPI0017721BB0|nr:toll/interleukin-1 receptor domain-containing protein [Listeria monocytogenes]MCH5033864.1 toll/interleukin-1 receptor domain-containing protein [Listeria monocytogenes]HAA8611223.1 hypothetical protein [Listeria monocytogenes]